jgi:hypothetical protein
MKNLFFLLLIILLSTLFINRANARDVEWHGEIKMKVQKLTSSGLDINYSLKGFSMDKKTLKSLMEVMLKVKGCNIVNTAGNPDLPGISRFIVVPKSAVVQVQVSKSRIDIYKNVDIRPAIMSQKEKGGQKISFNKGIVYRTDTFFPSQTVEISQPMLIRGINVVKINTRPFQYNPIKRELRVYKDIKVEISFEGGGLIGGNSYRSRWWDPILKDMILNHNILPQVNLNRFSSAENKDFEYIIICPDNPGYLQWADSLKKFRNLQGIRTGIVTLTEIGGNYVNSIKNYIKNAYNNWTIKPAGVLLIGDYGMEGPAGDSLVSPLVDAGGYGRVYSDIGYGDINENFLPDIIISRLPARSPDELKNMVSKIIGYERNPPTSADFYDKPLMATRGDGYLLFTEVIRGFLKKKLNKYPETEYVAPSSGPITEWQEDTEYFGPEGLGYIEANSTYVTDYSGSTEGIVNALNSGAFMAVHRDHGLVDGWMHPSFKVKDMSCLHNVNPFFVFSINCYTGSFVINFEGEINKSDSFAEAIIKNKNGAVGVIAASSESYQEVNEKFGYGVFDYLWPDFMPDKSATPVSRNMMPAFANAAGKFHLADVYNVNNDKIKWMIYIYHYFGGVFSTMYSEVPQRLNVVHNNSIEAGSTSFSVTANQGSLIALTANGKIIGTATGTGSNVNIAIPSDIEGTKLTVTVTMQNYFRYERSISITNVSAIGDNAAGRKFYLSDNYPNPFNPSTMIKYGLPQTGHVTLIVYDIKGRKVKTLVNNYETAGEKRCLWNGKNTKGQTVAAGMYFFRITVKTKTKVFTSIKKGIFLK